MIVGVGEGFSSQRDKTAVCGASEFDADTSQFTLVGDERREYQSQCDLVDAPLVTALGRVPALDADGCSRIMRHVLGMVDASL